MPFLRLPQGAHHGSSSLHFHRRITCLSSPLGSLRVGRHCHCCVLSPLDTRQEGASKRCWQQVECAKGSEPGALGTMNQVHKTETLCNILTLNGQTWATQRKTSLPSSTCPHNLSPFPRGHQVCSVTTRETIPSRDVTY